MAEISDLAVLDANNTGRFPNGMPVTSINDAARALEGIIAREHKDTNGSIITGGTATAYTVTTNRSITSLSAGIVLIVRAGLANTGSATLALNGLTAKPLVRQNGGALVSGDILQHQILHIVYNASTDKFHCLGILA